MLMTSPLKKLLVLGALVGVAPLGAEPRENTDPPSSHANAPLFSRRAQSVALLP
jgi:hypothetical protein